MKPRALILALLLLGITFQATGVAAQELPPRAFFVDASGRVRVQVTSSPDHYYVLYFREDLPSGPDHALSMPLGQQDMTTLTEPLSRLCTMSWIKSVMVVP